jgi:TRAP-type C4-dicarboxylate transport system permease large subunit
VPAANGFLSHCLGLVLEIRKYSIRRGRLTLLFFGVSISVTKPRELRQTLLKVAWGSVRVPIIISVASAFSWIMVREQIPQAIAAFIFKFTVNSKIVLLLVTVLLLIVGLLAY